MAAVTYIFQQGDTIKIPLLLVEGDRDLVTNMRANLKLTVGSRQTPPLATPAAASFTVVNAVEGWILELSSTITSALKPGLYVFNAAMEITGSTIVTDPSYIKLEPSTTV
jgi:hypothetical protein